MQSEKRDSFVLLLLVSIVCFTIYSMITVMADKGDMKCLLGNSTFVYKERLYKLVDKNGEEISCIEFK